MNKKQRAVQVQAILDTLAPNPQIFLAYTSPYTLLIAVLLSAQCQDARVNQITPLLFAQADTPSNMVELGICAIEKTIRPCGISNNKAKAIWQLSQMLIEDFGGDVPQTIEELETLPGVGHKTASVVASQGFGIAAFPVDTHIHRCAQRWGLTEGKTVKETEKNLKALFPKASWNKLHLQIISYGRQYCPARGHRRDACPICSALYH